MKNIDNIYKLTFMGLLTFTSQLTFAIIIFSKEHGMP